LIAAINKNKQNTALLLAIIFHTVGLIGILLFNRDFFISLTPLNLLVSLALVIWTQEDRNQQFWLFVTACFVTGIFTEWLGVHHQLLFGSYKYLSPLGYQWQDVPLLIGVNWFVIMYSCGTAVQIVLNKIWNRLKDDDMPARNNVGFWAIVLDGALLATFFDWVMEPVAVKLGFWQWLGDGSIPFKNYWSWFLVSAFLLLLFRLLRFQKNNLFAVHLLLIQLLFFLILRTFL
jgi:bisanhydrobacterioruberin hydratase